MKKFYYLFLIDYWSKKAFKYMNPRYSSEKLERATARISVLMKKFEKYT